MCNHRFPLTNIINKLTEKCINQWLVDFLSNYKTLNNSQHDFQKAKSTMDVISEVLDYIYNTLENRTNCIVVFLDPSKTFDIVNNKTLLYNTKTLGMRDIHLKL